MSHFITEANTVDSTMFCLHNNETPTKRHHTIYTHAQNLLPAGGSVTCLQVMDNVKQSSDPVLVGCQAGLHSLKPLL